MLTMQGFLMLLKLIYNVYTFIVKIIRFFTPFGELAARLWVGYVFLKSGLLKYQAWESTVFLFTYEFQVPLIPPYYAAILGTAAEIFLPIFVILGLGGRISTLGLFLFNLAAVVSYPFLWTPEGAEGLAQHINWGLIIALLMFHGTGKFSIDYWLVKKYGIYFKYKIRQID